MLVPGGPLSVVIRRGGPSFPGYCVCACGSSSRKNEAVPHRARCPAACPRPGLSLEFPLALHRMRINEDISVQTLAPLSGGLKPAVSPQPLSMISSLSAPPLP